MPLTSLYEPLVRLVRARSQAGGLELSDTAVRYAVLRRGAWQFEEVALPPGIMSRGIVQNEPALVAALTELHARVAGRKSRRRLLVVASLSSAPVYSQVFTLPKLADAEMAKAIQLNMQMNSPTPLPESSSGWQEVSAVGAQSEILAASLPNAVTVPVLRIIAAAGFLPVVLEARAFSIARVVRTWTPGFDPSVPYLVVVIDDAGLDVLIVRYGTVYLEYSSFWADIQGDAPTLSMELFEEHLAREVGLVLNFHRQHSTEEFKEAIVIAPSLTDRVAELLTSRFGIAAHPFAAPDGVPPSSTALVAIGAAVRGSQARAEDREINLAGLTAQAAFEEQQIVTYLDFWRVMIPAFLGVLFLTTLVGYAFVASTAAHLHTQAAGVHIDPRVETQLTQYEGEARDFNNLVDQLGAAQASLRPKSVIAASVVAAAAQGNIALGRIFLTAAPSLSIVSGTAPSEDAVLAFKKLLQQDTRLTNVTLPITDIHSTPQGISFSMTFTSDFAAAPKTP